MGPVPSIGYTRKIREMSKSPRALRARAPSVEVGGKGGSLEDVRDNDKRFYFVRLWCLSTENPPPRRS